MYVFSKEKVNDPVCSGATNSGTKNIAAVSKDSGDFILIYYYYSAKIQMRPVLCLQTAQRFKRFPQSGVKLAVKRIKLCILSSSLVIRLLTS